MKKSQKSHRINQEILEVEEVSTQHQDHIVVFWFMVFSKDFFRTTLKVQTPKIKRPFQIDTTTDGSYIIRTQQK